MLLLNKTHSSYKMNYILKVINHKLTEDFYSVFLCSKIDGG